MRLEIAIKGFKLYEKIYHHLFFHLLKISQRLPHFKSDLPHLKLVIKKTIKKYHTRKHYHPSYSNYADRKTAIALYDGSIALQLPKKPLFVSFQGITLQECIDQGIDRLKKEIEKYKQSMHFSRENLKDLHFKSQTEYLNHSSSGKAEIYG